MNRGFFITSKLQQEQTNVYRVARCGLCGLYKHSKTPKMAAYGQGRKKILLVAEAPGEHEDEEGRPLVGEAGMYLETILDGSGIDMSRDCWRTNACICHPGNNETPNSEKIRACYPNLIKTINKLKPNAIILLGATAVESLIEPLWKEKVEGIGKWAGFQIPCQKHNAWICPTYHPSYLKRMNDSTLELIFKRHLKQAIQKSDNKPFKKIPDYKDDIEIILRPAKAAKVIRYFNRQRGRIAFDYETNMLKPEPDDSEIVSCSVCWQGKKTISFPWMNETIDAMAELLKSDSPKIAGNTKFEDRWTRAKLGFPVKNWFWDTMIAAHIIDNRPGITSIKFQAFVLFGMERYNTHIESFLKGEPKNRIKELDLKDLLLYGGLDSLLEYKIAMKQIKVLDKRGN